MDKMDEGLQYIVYDLGNKVRKEPKSRSEMVDYLRKFHDSEEKIQNGVDNAIERRKKVEAKFEGRSLPVLADFEISGSTIIQQKLKVTGDALEDADSVEQKKKVIDKYVGLIKQCWSYGIHDMSYNFTLNTGMDEKGRVVQLDLGDLIFDKQRIKEEVRNQVWLEESVSYTKYMDPEVKPCYKKRMGEEVTVENLENNWRKSLEKD